MTLTLNAVIQLLHQTSHGALATHSTQLPGYPYATVLPFVVDEQHCPVFLISGLAEHTKNLDADGRASFLVTETGAGDVLNGARMTLVGDVVAIEASPGLVTRYVRYFPDGQNYLALGDFRFFRFTPRRLRLIAGFGHMGWMEEDAWRAAAVLPLEDEYRQLGQLADVNRHGQRLLGLDRYGIDTEDQGRRRRWTFAEAPVASGSVVDEARALLLNGD
jgi:putative heme iron utilization protein